LMPSCAAHRLSRGSTHGTGHSGGRRLRCAAVCLALRLCLCTSRGVCLFGGAEGRLSLCRAGLSHHFFEHTRRDTHHTSHASTQVTHSVQRSDCTVTKTLSHAHIRTTQTSHFYDLPKPQHSAAPHKPGKTVEAEPSYSARPTLARALVRRIAFGSDSRSGAFRPWYRHV
jgi:hypothetical protein